MKSSKKYHLIYQITNLINGRFYIGMTSTNDICNRYMGSGKILHRAFKKYGIKNFKKDIICFASNREELEELEANFVTPEFIEANKGLIYNLKPGGRGGGESHRTELTKKKIGNYWRGRKRKPFSKEHKQRMSSSHLGKKRGPQTLEDRLKKRLAHLGIAKNKIHIHNGFGVRKMIYLSDLDSYLKEGWIKGRGALKN